ncbi:MAG: hypothetical protein AB7G06_08565 [Bdellovibrionales bacterium]
MKHILALTAALMATLTAGTTMAETTGRTEVKADGGYTSSATSSTTTTAGTDIKTEKKVDVDVDKDGKVIKKTTSEKVTDPEGPMNEKRSTVETKIKQGDKGYESESSVTNTNAEGTSTRETTKQKVKVDAQGRIIETTKTEKTVDPEGLLNQETTTTETKKVDGQTVDVKRD